MEKIRKKKDFDFIFKNGKSCKDKLLVLKYIKNNLKENRVAFIVSSKVSKSAVKRNKIRRRLYEMMRKRNNQNISRHDLVFIALPGMEKVDFKETEEMVRNLFIKAHV